MDLYLCIMAKKNNVWILAIEIFFVEIIVFLGLWLWNEQVAKVFTFIIPLVCGAILLIAVISELLERTKISRLYFIGMLISVLTPLLVAFFYLWLNDKPFSFF